MADLTAQRTLVKSPPELWSELSEVGNLAKHLGELGEIRITKMEPETTVAWEGEQISGTVELEQSGWGTRVTFHATVPEPDSTAALPEPRPIAVAPDPEPASVKPGPASVEPGPIPDSETAPELDAKPKRVGFLARWLFRERRPVEPDAVAVPSAAPPAPEPVPTTQEPVTVEFEAVDLPPEPARDLVEAQRVQAVLDSTLEALGQAHHRPFSRG